MKTIYLSGVVGWDITADRIREQADMKSQEKLRVIVNSPGGYVDDAFEIYDLFQTYKGEIEFVIMAYAASAMSYIVMSGDKISAFKNSIWMAHKVQSIAIGDDDDMFREGNISKGMNNILAEAYAKRLSGSREEILAKMKNEIWAIGWEQLIDAGLIDNVIDNPEELEIPDIKEDEKEELFLSVTDNIETEKLFAAAKTKVIAVQNKIRKDEERMKESIQKAAAFIKDLNPVKPENNKKLEANMNLQEFLKANPDAKAEFDEALRAAREDGQALGSADVNAERQRIFNMLRDSGTAVTKELADAINQGTPDLEFARAELQRQRAKRDKTDGIDFGTLVVNQTPGEQDKKTAGELKNKKKSDEEFDKETDAMISKINEVGGKK
jgi:ATP-dependent Clp protease protease subunit